MFKGLTKLHSLHLTITTVGMLISFLWPSETFLRIAALWMWMGSVALFLSSLESNKKFSSMIFTALLRNRVRTFGILFLLIGVLFAGLILIVSRTLYSLPPLVLYLPVVVLWPLLTIQLLKISLRDRLPNSTALITRFQQILVSIFLFWAFLEILLQLGFNYIPPQITMAMPQVPRRIGIRYVPELKLDLYSPGKVVYMMDGFSGDLAAEVCSERAKAQPRTIATYTRDEYGFRNPMPWPDTIDIAFVGDSFTAGEAVQHPMWDGLSPALLELGLPGSGQIEQGILIRTFALPHKPKVVIMAYYEGNDLVDNWNYRRLSNANRSRYDDDGSIPPWNYLVSYHLLLWLRDKLVTNDQQRCQNEIIDANGNALVFGTYDSSSLTLEKDALHSSAIFSLTSNAIQEIAKEVQDAGAQFIILFIPQKLHTYWNVLDAQMLERASRDLTALQPDPLSGLKPEPLSTSDGLANRLTKTIDVQRDIIKETAQSVGALFLDLTPAFQSAADNGKVLYFYADVHLNQAGHDLARDVIREFLLHNNLLN